MNKDNLFFRYIQLYFRTYLADLAKLRFAFRHCQKSNFGKVFCFFTLIALISCSQNQAKIEVADLELLPSWQLARQAELDNKAGSGDFDKLLANTTNLAKKEEVKQEEANSGTLPTILNMAEAVEWALEHNPSLAAEQAQFYASNSASKAERGNFGPSLNLNYNFVKQDRYTSQPQMAKAAERGTFSWGFEVSQPVFQGFRLLSNWNRALLQAENDAAAVQKAKLSLVESVQVAFLNYLRARENVQSAKDSLSRLLDQLSIAKAYYNVGLSPRLDVLQAEVNVSEAEQTLIAAENMRDTYLAELNTYLGFPATANLDYAGELKQVSFTYTLEECLAKAYQQRPDLVMASKSVAIAKENRRGVQSQYYPQISAYYDLSEQGNSLDMKKAGQNGSHFAMWEVGARASWNIFQWGSTWYADQQASWQIQRMQFLEADLKLAVGHEVKTRLLSVWESEKRITFAEKGVVQAKEAWDMAVARYHEHVGTNFDVLDASANLTAAHAALTGAKADFLTALVQLRIAMAELIPDIIQ